MCESSNGLKLCLNCLYAGPARNKVRVTYVWSTQLMFLSVFLSVESYYREDNNDDLESRAHPTRHTYKLCPVRTLKYKYDKICYKGFHKRVLLLVTVYLHHSSVSHTFILS